MSPPTAHRRAEPWTCLLVGAIAAVATLVAGCGGTSTLPPTAPVPTPTSAPSSPSGSAAPSPGAATTAPSTAPSATAAPPFDPAAVEVELEPVTDVPGNPLAVTHAGDGSGRLFAADRGGRVFVVRDGRVETTPFLDIADRITAGGERGLLGLAFHPRFPDDPRVFVNYTDRNGDTVVSSFRLAAGDDRLDPASEAFVLRFDQPYANHNGGALVFGPDGMLYVATGDGGSAGDPHGNGQRLDTLLGKILRLDVDGRDGSEGGYRVPSDNPFVGRAGARGEIWLTGLRNPWRIAFDRATGDLWIGDVGQGRWEEIDVARDGARGLNFGWARMEGFHCFPSGEGCARPELTLPVTEYSHEFGCSVTGGAVYRGGAWPALVGAYLFADYCSGLVWAIDASADEVEQPTIVAETGRSISSFGEDEDGELWATDLSGTLLRVNAPRR